MPDPGRAIEILLVDDDPGDVLIVLDGFEDSKLTNRVHVARTGDAALELLRRGAADGDSDGDGDGAARPDLVLLALHLPRRDGRRVLAEIKADPDLVGLPVAVLTTSENEKRALRSEGLPADAYVTKPVEFASIVEVVRSVEDLYLSVVAAPTP